MISSTPLTKCQIETDSFTQQIFTECLTGGRKKNTLRNTGNTVLYKADMRLISWVSENNDNYQVATSAGFSHEYIV